MQAERGANYQENAADYRRELLKVARRGGSG